MSGDLFKKVLKFKVKWVTIYCMKDDNKNIHSVIILKLYKDFITFENFVSVLF